MYLKTFVTATAIAAVMGLPLSVHAQETHTLAPHFPDAFKLRTTTVSDAQIVMPDNKGGSTTQSSHSTMSWTTDTHKTTDGYQATIAIEAMDVALPDAAKTATPAATDPTAPAAPATPPGMNPADIQQKITAMLKLLGNPQVSYDTHMRPVRIDNLDALKANLKNMITVSVPSQNAQQFSQIYDLFTTDITPESAASMLRLSMRSRLPFDKPLPLHTAVPLDKAAFDLYGASLPIGGTVTLESWEDGKAAHLTTVTEPAEADMHLFMNTLVDAVMKKVVVAFGQNVKPEQIDAIKPMITRFIDGTVIRVSQTCKIDVDLTDTALTHSDCATEVFARIDTSKMLTDEQRKASPEAAAKLQVMTVSETVHSVSDTVIAN